MEPNKCGRKERKKMLLKKKKIQVCSVSIASLESRAHCGTVWNCLYSTNMTNKIRNFTWFNLIWICSLKDLHWGDPCRKGREGQICVQTHGSPWPPLLSPHYTRVCVCSRVCPSLAQIHPFVSKRQQLQQNVREWCWHLRRGVCLLEGKCLKRRLTGAWRGFSGGLRFLLSASLQMLS